MSENIVYATDASFEADVINSTIPTLVDFWAEWCGPCKMIGPLLEEVADQYEGRLKVVKVDVDANPDSPAKYGVRGIPTLLVVKGGEVVATKVGALSKGQLIELIDQNI